MLMTLEDTFMYRIVLPNSFCHYTEVFFLFDIYGTSEITLYVFNKIRIQMKRIIV